ncbi:MAG: transglutaminase domain-containing protein [Oscillospiraceae bacterium]|nr:transglutaminase domain-containing protein [Oscillospiraceae bacterium]
MKIGIQIRKAAALLCFFAVFSFSAGEGKPAAAVPTGGTLSAKGLLTWKETGDGTPRVDLSNARFGCVAVSYRSERRLKLQVAGQTDVRTYDMPSDGTRGVFPLLSGDGEYRFRILENTEGERYGEVYAETASVTLTDELQPFLHPNEYADYDADSACVRAAETLAPASADETEIVAAVCAYIRENVSYDAEKASYVGRGYVPDPDAALRSGRGICFDYASLTAAMLRSRGIPARLVVGSVGPEALCHAWNEFYSSSEGTWKRLDLTYAAAVPGGSLEGAKEEYVKKYEF